MKGEGLRVIIAGGGTGGHFFPGLAVAHALVEKKPLASVLFAGTRRGIEAKLAPRYGFPFAALPAAGVAGVGALARLRALATLPLSVIRAIALVADFRPGAVVSVGGYASFPVAIAAGLLGFPLLVLEQNVAPGLANRAVSTFACAVAVSFPRTLEHFRGKGRLLGNPVRASLAAVPREAVPECPLRLLIFGGSRGARAINDALIAALPEIARFEGGVEILHQTGAEDFDRVRSAYAASGVKARVEPFIEAMDEAYAWCHAVLCRAGATTLAELAATKRPAVLVPFPQAAGDHQTENARGMEALGGALCIEQKDLTAKVLVRFLSTLADKGRREVMASALAKVARPQAARDIADLVLVMAEAAP